MVIRMMEFNYKKPYTYLVGQIDDVLQFMAGELVTNSSKDQRSLLLAGNRLKEALLTAEDMYLNQEDEEG